MMGRGRCCCQGGRCWAPGMGGGKGTAVKVDEEAPGFMVTSVPSTGHAVEAKERSEWRRRMGKWD